MSIFNGHIMRQFLALFLVFSPALANGSIRAGDILLQPLDCWSCELIVGEEKSPYSHIALALDSKTVIEAYGKVRIISLQEFLGKTGKDKKVLVKRSFFEFSEKELKIAASKIQNLPYDSKFLWDDETLYCSELVYKILARFVEFTELAPKPMHFDYKPEMWRRFFRGDPPVGELGISPGDFDRSTDFYTVKEL